MDAFLDYLERLAPFLALAALLAAMVVAINVLGRRLEKHAEWLALLDVRVGNLDKDRKATWARNLQRPFDPSALEMTERQLVPPPMPPRAPTIDATDWRDDESVTEELQKKQTGRYPHGQPPKEPDDEQ